MSDDIESEPQAHTVRLELVDRPGELLRALEPIANQGGNLLSIFHERGNITPRGHIPVEVDLECPPERFDAIVESLRDAGVNVMQAGAERYSEEIVVLLVGELVQGDLSDTLSRIEDNGDSTVVDFSLQAPAGPDEDASARLRLATEPGALAETLGEVRSIADGKDLRVITPVDGVEA